MPWRPRLCSIKYGRTWHRVVPTVTPVTRAAPVWFPWLLLIFEEACVCVCSLTDTISCSHTIPPVSIYLSSWGLVGRAVWHRREGAFLCRRSCVSSYRIVWVVCLYVSVVWSTPRVSLSIYLSIYLTTMVVPGLGRAFLCLSLSVCRCSVCVLLPNCLSS